MKKPSDSEIQAFQIGVNYAMQTYARAADVGKSQTPGNLCASVNRELIHVAGSHIIAEDALTTRLPVNVRKPESVYRTIAPEGFKHPPLWSIKCPGCAQLTVPYVDNITSSGQVEMMKCGSCHVAFRPWQWWGLGSDMSRITKTDLGDLSNPENVYPPGRRCETCGGSGNHVGGSLCYRCEGTGIQPERTI